jgi:aryl-alcohol dehydrogenase-like predicted oxidoreductase
VNYRSFGRTPFRVSEIGLGCSRLGGAARYKHEKELLDTVLQAFDRGINFFDTADSYAQGGSERLLGSALRGRRAAAIIATKAGYRLTATGRIGAKLKPLLRPLVRSISGLQRSVSRVQSVGRTQEFSPDYIRRAIESSLLRLQTDYIDVFQLHNPPSEVIESGDLIPTLDRARSEGKIRCYGISCRTVEDATLCLRHPSISSIQLPINLLDFKGIASFLLLAEQENVAVIARQPLASGYLARPAVEIKAEHFSAREEEFKRKLDQARGYQFLAVSNRRTIAQAALNFVLALRGVSVVITGMSDKEHLEENLAAPACSFTPDELATTYMTLAANT